MAEGELVKGRGARVLPACLPACPNLFSCPMLPRSGLPHLPLSLPVHTMSDGNVPQDLLPQHDPCWMEMFTVLGCPSEGRNLPPTERASEQVDDLKPWSRPWDQASLAPAIPEQLRFSPEDSVN
ncbi:uncharacterized protein [Physcomitrium patens]|uniref:uncharacterized protein n=1 Tax=Physcomitrium patens TaxID=3218 RepID=UPI003CCCA43F